MGESVELMIALSFLSRTVLKIELLFTEIERTQGGAGLGQGN